jgi:hypothetical protein
LVPNICPLPFGGAGQIKSILTRCDHIGFVKHLVVLLEETPIQMFVVNPCLVMFG